MKRAWIRWTIRIGAGTLAAIVILAGFFVYRVGPQNALLLAAVLLQPLLLNTRPPPIFADRVTRPESSQDLTAPLRKKFPVGTDVRIVRATLLSQGFKPPKPPPAACWPQGKPAPVGQVIFPCPLHDPAKTLEYQWSHFPCGDTIVVWWSSAESGELTDIGGYHYYGCL